ncbi:hypothetical protein [Cohaesibacter sp. ES.047]|uniref:hypothetical protein n=1 Tax=Cohaesibacter sp. ES.047 TaxID=1798205 RepID=UPI000BB81AE3|nr:hypothetical protein [Cohaesibacter sp. ES.047]
MLLLSVQIGAALMHGLVGKCLEYLSGVQHILSELGVRISEIPDNDFTKTRTAISVIREQLSNG